MSKIQPEGNRINSNRGASGASYEYTQRLINRSWDENSAVLIAFNGSTANISGSGAVFAGGILTIREPGTYVLSGTLENGQVLINAGKNDVISLVLNGVSLRNETGPAIYAPKSKEIALIIEEGTRNTVSDGSSRTALTDDEPDAAIYIQDSLSISGSGILNVGGNYRHGIRAQDILTITGGVISVNSVVDAVRGRDGIVINNGSFTIEAGGDGIKSNNDKDSSRGYVTITGGTFDIKAGNDGIQAESVLAITGGVFKIVTGGGSANAPIPAQSSNRGWGRQTPVAQTTTEESTKGIKAGSLINISGGDITIDAKDDGVHSNGGVIITSGKLSIRTGDDGIHADTAVEISGGDIDIPVCNEGVEGLSVTISGGRTVVVSRDDAINAADGSASGGRTGWGRSLNESIFVRISGGTVDLFALHDGIDANGNVFIEGGTVKISGPSQMMEGAIDFDGSLFVTGGELITAGSVLSASQNSRQPVVFVSYNRQQPSGSVIAVKDSRGNTLLEYTSKTAYSYSGFTSPSFKIGETYSLFINGGKRVDFRLNDIIFGIGDDGGAYNGGRGVRRR
jgi:hypothetical protein